MAGGGETEIDRDTQQRVAEQKTLYIWNIQPYAVLSQASTVHQEGCAEPELGEPRQADAPPQGRRPQYKEPAAALRAGWQERGNHGVHGKYQSS